MPRFSLRTLIVVMLLGGPVLAGVWWSRGILHTFGALFVVINTVMASLILLGWMNFRQIDSEERLLLALVTIGWLICVILMLPAVMAARE